MLNFSNVLSLSRLVFALAFLQQNPYIRLAAIFLAMLSDFFDGYIARRSQTTTQLGAILDPLTDKCFVFFACAVFFMEDKLAVWQLISVFSRDISLCIFGVYLGIVKGWKGYEVKAIWWGKITTVAQFLLLIGLTVNTTFPSYIYYLFIIMGIGAFLELLLRYIRASKS